MFDPMDFLQSADRFEQIRALFNFEHATLKLCASSGPASSRGDEDDRGMILFAANSSMSINFPIAQLLAGCSLAIANSCLGTSSNDDGVHVYYQLYFFDVTHASYP